MNRAAYRTGTSRRRPLRESNVSLLDDNVVITLDNLTLMREEDNYDLGEIDGDSFYEYYDDLPCIGNSYESLKDLFEDIALHLDVPFSQNTENWGVDLNGSTITLDSDIEVNKNWEKPTDLEWKQFKAKKINLYNAKVLADVSVHVELSLQDQYDAIEKAMGY